MIIRSKRIYCEDDVVDGFLVIEDRVIKAIEGRAADLVADLDVGDKRIIPGIIDTHNHGTMGYNLIKSVPDVDAEIKAYLKGLAYQGVTGVFPTCDPAIIKDVARLAKEEQDGAKIVGIHSEGPYLNRVGEKGIDTGHPDIDMDFVKQMVTDGAGLLKLVALAPEIPDATKAIHYLKDNGVRLAFAHSNCDYQEALASFKEGISVSTHTANVMSGIHHRRMGGLGACLLDEELWCEIICDGMHVSDEMMKLMFKVKPYTKFMMVSDNSSMAGAPIGRYDLRGFLIVNIDEQGFCLSDTGRLCGSTKPVLYDIGHLVQALNIPLATCLKMAALNPAICYGLAESKGSIKVGKDADFVIIDDDYQALATYSEGRKVYDCQLDKDLFNPQFMELYKQD